MIRKSITLAAAGFAAVALALGGAAAASASTHPNAVRGATLTCGFACNDLSSLVTGPNKILNAANDGWMNLRDSGVLRTNEDFLAAPITTVGTNGTAGTACGTGELSATSIFCISTTYENDTVYEEQSAPNGNGSHKCAGAQSANVSARIVLRPCGESATTLWVADSGHGVFVHGQGYTPWLNGADTNFSNDQALTVNASSKVPTNVLRTNPEDVTAGHFVPDTQQFNVTFGPVS